MYTYMYIYIYIYIYRFRVVQLKSKQFKSLGQLLAGRRHHGAGTALGPASAGVRPRL